MLLYFESVLAEQRGCVVTIPEATSPTLNILVMTAMRAHARPGPFLQHIRNRWKSTPDWRFDRQVIRMGLYLREFVGVEAGDRVAIVSETRREWLVADLATAGLGAISVAIRPTMDPLLLSALLADTAPKAVFVSETALSTVEVAARRLSSIRAIISFDAIVSPNGTTPMARVIDLAGTLDTPERAQWWRSQARDCTPQSLTLRHYEPGYDDSPGYVEMTQGAVRDAVTSHWTDQPAWEGDVAYVASSEMTLPLRLSLYGFVADGYTTVAFGSPEHAADEIATLQPAKIVAPPDFLERTVAQQLASPNGHKNGRGLSSWMRSVETLIPAARSRTQRDGVRQALGGRIRWVRPTGQLDQRIAEHLGTVATIDTNGAAPHEARPKATAARDIQVFERRGGSTRISTM